MSGDYDRLRQLLLEVEQQRLEALQEDLRETSDRVPDRVAEEIERGLGGQSSRLTAALGEATISGLEQAVQRKPETVVNAVFPVIGPAIRKSLQEAMRQLSADIDHKLNAALSAQSWQWRIEAWRSGVPYAQVVLRHTLAGKVEHLFLIQPESGLLLGHVAAPNMPELDADAIAGMFTAIQSFVRDSVQSNEGGIGTATVGDYQLVVSEGPQAKLVAFVRGVPPADFPVRLHELNEALHARAGAVLLEHGGTTGDGVLDEAELQALNAHDEETAPAPRSNAARHVLIGFGILVAVLLAWWIVVTLRWHRQVDAVRAQLDAMPGVMVTQLDAGHRGRLRIEGLRDPLAQDPQAWLQRTHPQVVATWKLRGYLSLDPEIVAMRDGQAAKARIRPLLETLQGLTIPFVSGSAAPDAGWETTMEQIKATLRQLQQIAGKDARLDVRISGLTDESGSADQNAALRLQRGQWLADQLRDVVRSPSMLEVEAEAGDVESSRGARAMARIVPLATQADAKR